MTEQEEKVIASNENLITKLVSIMGDVQRIPKNGHNAHHNYDYALESDIKEVTREELASRGLLLVSNEKSRSESTIQTKNGTQRMVSLEIEFTIFDKDSKETIVFTGFGEGQDSGDKAVYKAKTGALKYALTSLFLIPTGDDPESSGKSLQPKMITPDQVKYLQDLGLKVANLAGTNGNQIVGRLKVDLNNMKDFDKYTEEEFANAVRKLDEWKNNYQKRQQTQQNFNERSPQNNFSNYKNQNMTWGMN